VVLFLTPLDRACLWFSCVLPSSLVDVWSGGDVRQVIGQAELLPIAVARCLFRSRLMRRSLIAFIDNESARCGLIRAFSPVEHSLRIISTVTSLDIQDGVLTWYERVPTASNPADAPSRGHLPERMPGWGEPFRYDLFPDECSLIALGLGSGDAGPVAP